MAILGFDHVQLAIPEGGENRARAYYVGLLGMREVKKPANLSPKGCWFESGTLNLHLGVDPDFRPARKAHPALLVDDLLGLRQVLEGAGYPTFDDKTVEGYCRFFSHDPFENRIEFMQSVPA